MSYSKRNANGQGTMANSSPVVIASDQTAVPITDNSGSITVDASSLPLPTGASTSAKQPALGTAGTASSDVLTVQGIASMTALKTDGSAVTQPVSAASLPLPTGASTAANQTTGNSSLSSIDTKLTDKSQFTKLTDGTDTALITAAGEQNVIATAQPGVDIGDVTINNASGASAVNIQDGGNSITVDGTVTIGTSVTPGTAATNLGKAEDAAHSSGDVGVMALAVRNDAGTALAGSDGDYIPPSTDATGALRMSLTGVVSTSNSTSSVLSGGAAFTGTGEDVTNYNEIRISVIASHASATDGLSIQQSSDNTNWDITDTYTIPATTGKTFSVPRQAKYFRVVYTNGATLQTSFRLQTILNRAAARVSSQRAGDGYSNETDLEQQQAFLMGYNGSTWDRVRTTGTGVLSTSAVLTAGSALVGKVGIDQTTPGTTNAVVDTPVTSGGLSIVTGSVGATATAIKASAGQLYGYHLFNTTAAVAYVQIFNVATGSVTLGTTAPTMSIGIPASGGVTVNFDKGIAFSTAISFACTTTRTGSSGATCDVNFFYK